MCEFDIMRPPFGTLRMHNKESVLVTQKVPSGTAFQSSKAVFSVDSIFYIKSGLIKKKNICQIIDALKECKHIISFSLPLYLAEKMFFFKLLLSVPFSDSAYFVNIDTQWYSKTFNVYSFRVLLTVILIYKAKQTTVCHFEHSHDIVLVKKTKIVSTLTK